MGSTRLSHRELPEFPNEGNAGEGNSMGFECLEVIPGSGVPGGRRVQGGEQKEQRMAGERTVDGGRGVPCRYSGENHRGGETQKLWRVRGNETCITSL